MINKVVGNGLVLNVDALIRRVLSQSYDATRKQINTDKDIKNRMLALQDASHNPWLVCCGHDLVEILSFGLRGSIGTTKDAKSAQLEIALRLAYEWAYFRETELYLAIRQWEKDNDPFQILRSEEAYSV